jgi:hypothetical protein
VLAEFHDGGIDPRPKYRLDIRLEATVESVSLRLHGSAEVFQGGYMISMPRPEDERFFNALESDMHVLYAFHCFLVLESTTPLLGIFQLFRGRPNFTQ